MKITDYSKIAKVYDNNPARHHQPKEQLINYYLSISKGQKVRVLDLACGTGNYLRFQRETFNSSQVGWYGFDKSDQMLAKAREKNPDIDFQQGSAHNLPYSSGFFDIVHCSFAFHHFEQKAKVLKEISRILKKNGRVILVNICPELMEANWIYHFFPSARRFDLDRFWPEKRLLKELRQQFTSPVAVVSIVKNEFDSDQMTTLAKNRDMSQLNLISDKSHSAGLKKLKALKKKKYFSELATLRFIGIKP